MKRRIGWSRMACAIGAAAIVGTILGGCASDGDVGPFFGPDKVSLATINAMSITFADDHLSRMTEATDALLDESASLADRARLNAFLVERAYATFGNASASNPLAGMMDMLVMVSLSREALRRSAIDRTLTEEQRSDPASFDMDLAASRALMNREERTLYEALGGSEEEIRSLARLVFWPEQVEQFDTLAAAWWLQNPARRRVSLVRLQDFARYRSAVPPTQQEGPRSLLGLLYLDPLASMNPAARELAQSRIFAERLSFQTKRMPIILSLSARSMVYEWLSTEEIESLRRTLESSGESVEQLAGVAERWPQDVAVERDAAMRQFASLLREERATTVADLDAALTRHREGFFSALEQQNEPLQQTLSELDAALESATALSGSITETVRSIETMDTAHFQNLMETTAQSVGGVERSLGAIERLTAPGAMDLSGAGLGEGSTALEASLQRIINLAFRRLLVLILALAAGGVAIVLVAKFVPSRRAARAEA